MICETDAKQSEPRNFFWKNMKKGPKIHCLSLKLYAGPPNCITGASISGGQGGRAPGPPGFVSEQTCHIIICDNKLVTYHTSEVSRISQAGKLNLNDWWVVGGGANLLFSTSP